MILDMEGIITATNAEIKSAWLKHSTVEVNKMFEKALSFYDEKTNRFKYLCPGCRHEFRFEDDLVYYVADCTGCSYTLYYCKTCKELIAER